MKKNQDTPKRHFWLWVTQPEHYLNFWGTKERRKLDPVYKRKLRIFSSKDSGWWTCHMDTKQGDLALLYRTTLKSEDLDLRKGFSVGKDIAYLFQAESDAFSILNRNDRGWKYACSWKSLYKLKVPVTISEMKEEPYLESWSALKANFQGSAFAIPDEHWQRLSELIVRKNPEYKLVLGKVLEVPVPSITKEEDIENHLIETDFKVLKKHGYNLKFIARQVQCKGHGGRIDILCLDKKRGYVVIELKNVQADSKVIGQISGYMGWLKSAYAEKKPVNGLVISRGYDNKFYFGMSNSTDISQIDIKDLGLT